MKLLKKRSEVVDILDASKIPVLSVVEVKAGNVEITTHSESTLTAVNTGCDLSPAIELNHKPSLTQLLKLRAEIKQIQNQIDALTPEAINEALNCQSDSQVVLKIKGIGKVVLVMRTVAPSVDDDPHLARIEDDITLEKQRLARLNGATIESIESKIKELRSQLNQLSSSDKLVSLSKERSRICKENSTLSPSLAVYLD